MTPRLLRKIRELVEAGDRGGRRGRDKSPSLQRLPEVR